MRKILKMILVLTILFGTKVLYEAAVKEQAFFTDATGAAVSGYTYDGYCNNLVTKNNGDVSQIYMWFNSGSKTKKGISTGETEEIKMKCWIGSYDTARWEKNNGSKMSGRIALE